MPLKSKTISGFFWLTTGAGGRSIVQTLVVMVLARLLTPDDFGLVSAALVVISFTTIFSNMGIGPAVVQRKELSKLHIQNAFTISLILNVTIALIIFFSADLIAFIFNIDQLAPYIRTLSLVFLIRSISIVSEGLIQRRLQFKRIALIDFLSYVTYGVVGISFAFFEFETWALIYAFISQELIRSILLVKLGKHPKKIKITKKEFKELLYFGSGFSLARIFNSIANQGDNFVVGRWLGTNSLGLYNRAYQLIVMPANLFGKILDQIMFPIKAKVQDNNKKLNSIYLKGVFLSSIMTAPSTIIIYYSSESIVTILFGTEWLAMVPAFKVLTIGLIFRAGYKISDSLVRATGAVYKRARIQLIYAINIILFTFIGLNWGLLGVSIGVLLAITVNYILMAFLSIKLIKGKWTEYIKIHFGIILVSTITYSTIIFSNIIVENFLEHAILIDFVTITITVIITGTLMFILRKLPLLKDINWLFESVYKYFNRKV